MTRRSRTVLPPPSEAEPAALASYDELLPSHRRRYLGRIDEAKRPDTRWRRIEETIRMLHG